MKMKLGELGLQGWHGLTWTEVEIVGETPKKYRIKALRDMRLGGRLRTLRRGYTALVPRHAIRLLP